MSRARSTRADVRAFLRHLETVRNLSPNTLRAYGGDLDDLLAVLDAFGVTTFQAVDLFTLRRYLATLREKQLSPKSVARRISAIRALFRWLLGAGRIEIDPSQALRTPKRDRRLPRVLSPDEIEQLLETPPVDTWLGLRDRAIFETLYSTGARVSELAGLDLPDLDLADGTALLRGKGRKERLAGLGGPCLAALDAYFDAIAAMRVRRDRRAVFLNRYGARLSTRGIARVLDKHVAAAGLPSGVSPHTLRHSFATHILQAGANLREVQELLGHKNVASTQVYTHLTLDHLKQVYDRAHPRSGRRSKGRTR
ncbi:MAG: tyrosine recombinase XerC [Planctomycetota bacterium]|nr:tyrosine recombinase XerC [Planctomycetota bacterium]